MIVLFDRADSADIYYRLRWMSDVQVLYVEDGDSRSVWVPGFEYLRAREEILGDVTVEKLEDLKMTLRELKGPFVVPGKTAHAVVKELSGDVEVTREPFPGRVQKSRDELASVGEAQRVTAEAIALVEQYISEGDLVDGVVHRMGEALTSESLKAEARSFLIKQGYDCPDLIIASGSQTRHPHDRGSGPITEGAVIIDIFPQSERTRYFGDMTRSLVIGDFPREKEMLEAVRVVHDECTAMCVPGAKCCDIAAHAVRRLAELGFPTEGDSGLIHGLGHGVGLEIHESPSLHPKSEDVLKENMVITIEPGLYYEQGVRHESVVIVNEKPVVLGDHS